MTEEMPSVDAGQVFKFSDSEPAMADVILNGLSYQSIANSIETPCKDPCQEFSVKHSTKTSSSSSSFFSACPVPSSSSSSTSSQVFSSPESSLCSGSPHSVVTSTSSQLSSTRGPLTKCNLNNDKVKVLVRMRPFFEDEKVCPSKQVVCLLGNKILVKEHVSFQRGRQTSCKSFNQMEVEVDYVQDDSYVQVEKPHKKEEAQRRTFLTVGASAVNSALQGQNVTILAYGQAGTGKTYTIYGDGTKEGDGLLSRMASEMLHQVKHRDMEHECRIEVSFLEVYQEKLRDLLVNADMKNLPVSLHRMHFSEVVARDRYDYVGATRPEEDMRSVSSDTDTIASVSSDSFMDARYVNVNKAHVKHANAFCAGGQSKVSEESLKIREHPVMGTYVEGLLWKKVSCFSEIDQVLRYGLTNRTTMLSDNNSYSSRSHTLFSVRVTWLTTPGPGGTTVNCLNFVDLAGNEKPQNVSTERQNEMKYINKSLSQLNNVILSLSKSKFVSFRNSALTWLLKDSLNGKSDTILIATTSPAEKDFNGTLTTLKYALKAKRIQSPQPQRKDLRA